MHNITFFYPNTFSQNCERRRKGGQVRKEVRDFLKKRDKKKKNHQGAMKDDK
jgi:hypothetical protein